MQIIKASRREEIERQKAEYDKQYDIKKAAYDQDEEKYEIAEAYNYAEIENFIRDSLSYYIKSYPIDISVYSAWGGIRVNIQRERNLPENASLRWKWEALINENGKIKKESNSWSGMSATEPEQVEDLVATANLLRAIVALPWKSILEAGKNNMPNYEDYFTHENPGSRNTFSKEFQEADIQDAIDQGKFIKGDAIESTGYRPTVPIFYQIVGETDKSYKVNFFSQWALERAKGTGMPFEVEGPITVRKSSLVRALSNPIETIDDPNANLATL